MKIFDFSELHTGPVNPGRPTIMAGDDEIGTARFIAEESGDGSFEALAEGWDVNKGGALIRALTKAEVKAAEKWRKQEIAKLKKSKNMDFSIFAKICM